MNRSLSERNSEKSRVCRYAQAMISIVGLVFLQWIGFWWNDLITLITFVSGTRNYRSHSLCWQGSGIELTSRCCFGIVTFVKHNYVLTCISNYIVFSLESLSGYVYTTILGTLQRWLPFAVHKNHLPYLFDWMYLRLNFCVFFIEFYIIFDFTFFRWIVQLCFFRSSGRNTHLSFLLVFRFILPY